MKVFVHPEGETDGIPLASESLNARQVSVGVYELLNSSILHPDIAYGDLVEVLEDERGTLWFAKHVRRSSYSVVRVSTASMDWADFIDVMNQLQADGAGVTASNEGELAFATATLPPHMDSSAVVTRLRRQLGRECVVRILASRTENIRGGHSSEA